MGDEQPKKLQLIDKEGRLFRPDETGTVDRWFDVYMGKIYRMMNGVGGWNYYSTEIISMGVELFYTSPAALADADPEYFDFIYSVIRMGGS